MKNLSELPPFGTPEKKRETPRGSKNWFHCPGLEEHPDLIALEKECGKIETPHLGIDVVTDSKDLSVFLLWLNSLSKKMDKVDRRYGKLFYLTQDRHLTLTNASGSALTKMAPGQPADTPYDPVSGACLVQGPDRFTSLLSVALGLRGFQAAKDGILSLHSSLVEKTEDGEGCVLAGPSGAGKTTMSLGLTKRGYELISDDWVEVRQGNDGLVARPVLPLLSFKLDGLRNIQRIFDDFYGKEETGVMSFDKVIMPIEVFNQRWRPNKDIPLNRLVLLDNESRVDSINPDTFYSFQSSTNPHIPFLNSIASDSRPCEPAEQIQAIFRQLSADLLTGCGSAVKMNNKSMTVTEAIDYISGEK